MSADCADLGRPPGSGFRFRSHRPQLRGGAAPLQCTPREAEADGEHAKRILFASGASAVSVTGVVAAKDATV